MRKNFLCGLNILLVSLMVTGCQLLPEEAVLPGAPILHSYEVKEYKMDIVKRGDMIRKTSVSCNYMPAKEESLSFSLGGLMIDQLYVSEGQQVKKGQVLAQLENEDLLAQKEQLEYELELLQLQLKHYRELQEAEWVVLELKREQSGADELAESAYTRSIRDGEDRIYLIRIQLEEIQEKLEQRSLKAGMDGIVTYTMTVQEGDRSVKDKKVVTISDMESTAFIVKGQGSKYFEKDMEVVITQQRVERPAVVVEGVDLGLEENQEETTYLKLLQPDPSLEDGARGNIEVILEERLDVLYVDKDAVKTSNGETFVYMLDEQGLRVMHPVSVGMECEGNVEIISGLAEGDSVILD